MRTICRLRLLKCRKWRVLELNERQEIFSFSGLHGSQERKNIGENNKLAISLLS